MYFVASRMALGFQMFETFSMSSFLLGWFLSGAVCIYSGCRAVINERQGKKAWVTMQGKFSGYLAPVIVQKDRYSEWLILSAPSEPRHRVLMQSGSHPELLGAPSWRHAGEDEEGNKQIVMLGQVYLIPKDPYNFRYGK